MSRLRYKIALGTATMALAAVFATSGQARAAVAQLWPLKPFIQCTPDPRLWCESGAKAYAQALARQMPTAMHTVEQAQYGPFIKPIRVYVYDSIDTYGRYAGGRDGGGRTAFGAVHMSPVLRSLPGKQALILAHELSHLHLSQRAGALAMWRLPPWFREGYATLVSGGGGADGATSENAIFALVHGRHLEAEEEAALVTPHMWEHFKLPAPMFYRQSELMVDYMRSRDPAAFERMINGIEARKPFSDAVRAAYGQPLAALWRDFRTGLRSHPAARWDYSTASEEALK